MREEVAAHYRSKGYTIRERVQVRGRSGTVHAVDMVAQGPLGNLIIAFEDAGGFEGPELNAVRRTARDVGATPVVAARRFPERVRTHAQQSGVVLLDEQTLQAPPLRETSPPDEDPVPPWPDPTVRLKDPETTPWPTDAQARVQADAPLAPTDIDAVVDGWSRPEAPRTKSTDPGFWKYPRDGAAPPPPRPEPSASPPRPKATFAWLGTADGEPDAPSPTAQPAQRPTAPAGGRTGDPAVAAPAQRRAQAPAGPFGSTSDRRAPGALWRWLAAGAAFGASAGAVLYALLRLVG